MLGEWVSPTPMGLGKAWCCPAIGILLALGAQQLGRDIMMHRNPGESGNR